MNRLIVLGVFVALCSSCINFKPVTTSKVDSIHINSAGLQGLDVTIALVIDNPNNFAITVKEVDLDIITNRINLGHIHSNQAIRIAKKSSSIKELNFTISLKNTALASIPSLLSLIGTSKVSVSATGYVKARAFLINKKFAVNFTDGTKLK